MAVKLPPDIAELVTARVESGDFASPEEVLRAAMAPWIAASKRVLPPSTNCAPRSPKGIRTRRM